MWKKLWKLIRDAFRGVKIKGPGGLEIELDEKPGPFNAPHKPAPPKVGPGR